MSASSPLSAWRQEASATARLAGPLVLTNLTQAAIQGTDVVLLGWLGPRSLAAGALGSNIYIAFLIFGMGLVMAASPLMSRKIGAMPHSVRDVRRTVRQTMWAAVTIAIPVMLILWHAERLLILLGQDPALAHQAARFVRAIEWGLIPALFYLVLRSYVAALEQPAWALLIGLCGVVFNACLNYSLIFGKLGLPAMGIVGAGLGSSITQTMMFTGMVIVVMTQKRFRRYRLFGRFWRADWGRYATVWKLGAPIAMTLGLEITIFNAAVFLMGIVGTAALAAHAVAIQIASFTFMVPLGLSQAATVRVGLALGRRDRAGITRAGWTAWIMGVGFMTFTACLLWITPRTFVSLFLDTHSPADAAVVQLAISFLAIAAIFQIVDGAQAVGAGMLRGLHDTKIPMLFAGFGYWVVGLGVALWLGFHRHMGGVGIWIGLASGLAVVAVLMLARWLRRDAIGLARFG
ncbi:MAG TPA: MATE family efflux transporter [Sphingomonas sp.]|uniref:MATE family efflux transporter n=1 Tax=Sphingomonas sp. TaxID=28214 RepID=UPI002BBA8B88|nr:MATE family efflux transporter [Sphingomonas sp.]HMI18437.1 MATE family efflux transporter [Sphingomonas sp.]